MESTQLCYFKYLEKMKQHIKRWSCIRKEGLREGSEKSQHLVKVKVGLKEAVKHSGGGKSNMF